MFRMSNFCVPESRIGESIPVDPVLPNWQVVSITKCNNGFLVQVGCTSFVSTDWDKLSKALKLYWEDPVAAQEKYYTKRR